MSTLANHCSELYDKFKRIVPFPFQLITQEIPMFLKTVLSATFFVSMMACTLFAEGTKKDSKSPWLDLLPKNKLETHWTTKGNWKINQKG